MNKKLIIILIVNLIANSHLMPNSTDVSALKPGTIISATGLIAPVKILLSKEQRVTLLRILLAFDINLAMKDVNEHLTELFKRYEDLKKGFLKFTGVNKPLEDAGSFSINDELISRFENCKAPLPRIVPWQLIVERNRSESELDQLACEVVEKYIELETNIAKLEDEFLSKSEEFASKDKAKRQNLMQSTESLIEKNNGQDVSIDSSLGWLTVQAIGRAYRWGFRLIAKCTVWPSTHQKVFVGSSNSVSSLVFLVDQKEKIEKFFSEGGKISSIGLIAKKTKNPSDVWKLMPSQSQS